MLIVCRLCIIRKGCSICAWMCLLFELGQEDIFNSWTLIPNQFVPWNLFNFVLNWFQNDSEECFDIPFRTELYFESQFRRPLVSILMLKSLCLGCENKHLGLIKMWKVLVSSQTENQRFRSHLGPQGLIYITAYNHNLFENWYGYIPRKAITKKTIAKREAFHSNVLSYKNKGQWGCSRSTVTDKQWRCSMSPVTFYQWKFSRSTVTYNQWRRSSDFRILSSIGNTPITAVIPWPDLVARR